MRINKRKSTVGIGSALSLLAIATVPAIAESPQQENLVGQLPGQETSPQAEEKPVRVGKYILGQTINQDGGILFLKVPGEDGTVIVSGSAPRNSTVLLTRNDEGDYEFEGPAEPPWLMTLIEDYGFDPNVAVGSNLNAQTNPSTTSPGRIGTDNDSVNNPGRIRTNAIEQTAPQFENNNSGTSGNYGQNRSSANPSSDGQVDGTDDARYDNQRGTRGINQPIDSQSGNNNIGGGMSDDTRGVNPSNTQTGTNRSVTGTPQQQTRNDNQRTSDQYEGFNNDNNRSFDQNDRSINERDAGTTNNNNQPVRGLW